MWRKWKKAGSGPMLGRDIKSRETKNVEFRNVHITSIEIVIFMCRNFRTHLTIRSSNERKDENRDENLLLFIHFT